MSCAACPGAVAFRIARGRAAAVALLVGFTAAPPLHAQACAAGTGLERAPGWTFSPDALPILPRLPGPVTLDGAVTQAEWGAIPPLPLAQLWPTPGGPVSEQTEIYLAHDDEFIYAAGRFYERDPGQIRVNNLYRDVWNGDDAFDVLIDAFNDDQTALFFTTMPSGAQQDLEIRNDAEAVGGVEPVNVAWNTYWESATRITDEGWFAEVRIPLASLRFNVDDQGRAIMGIQAGRQIARRTERYNFPRFCPDVTNAALRPSLAQDMVLDGVRRDNPLYLTPYALGGVERQRIAAGVQGTVESTQEVGLDAKYAVSNGLTLDMTFNTDFAQAETDALQVNLDRFSLFYPEQRQFFQERASVFEFVHGAEGQLFHSRRIGLTDEGQPLRILGGVRLTGRVGAWDVGVMNLLVDGLADLPRSDDGVLRLKRQVRANGSTVGAMVTSRIRGDGTRSLAYGADALLIVGSEQFTLQVAQSDDARRSETFSGRSLARVLWQRPSTVGLGYLFDAAYSGVDYDPVLGFQRRGDFTSLKGRVSWGWRPDQGTFAAQSLAVQSELFVTGTDRSLQSGLIRGRWTGSFRGGGSLYLSFINAWEDLRAPLRLSENVIVPVGRYYMPEVFAFYDLGRGGRLSGRASTRMGRLFDGWNVSASLLPSLVLSKHLTVGGELTRQHIWFPARRESLDPNIYRLRVQAALNAHLSAEAFLQYSSLHERVTANLRARYRFSEGRDLYVVYDQLRDVGEFAPGLPGPARSDHRLLVKLAYTFW